jgi:hypothetical protein
MGEPPIAIFHGEPHAGVGAFPKFCASCQKAGTGHRTPSLTRARERLERIVVTVIELVEQLDELVATAGLHPKS